MKQPGAPNASLKYKMDNEAQNFLKSLDLL